MPTDEFYFGVTFQGNKRIFTPKSRNGKLHLPGQWAGSFSKDRPLGWDPVAAGNRAGDGMARFTCVGIPPLPSRQASGFVKNLGSFWKQALEKLFC